MPDLRRSTPTRPRMLRSHERRPAEEPADRRRGVPGVPVPAARPGGPLGIQARVRRPARRAVHHRHDPGQTPPRTGRTPFFAVGLEHGNSTIGNTILNIAVPARAQPDRRACSPASIRTGTTTRLFETTRNIMIVLLLKLVVEEYITHIGPFDFPIEAVPFIADEERWNRTELVRDRVQPALPLAHARARRRSATGPDALTSTEFLNNNPLVISRGHRGADGAVLARARRQDRPAQHARRSWSTGPIPACPSVEERHHRV